MKKTMGVLFGLAFATAVGFSAPCALSNGGSVSGCTATLGGADVSVTSTSGPGYGFGLVTPTINAAYKETIYTGDAANPFGAGYDTYVLTLTNITSNAGTGIEHVTLASFAYTGTSIAVATGIGSAATTITDVGGVVSFNFPGSGSFLTSAVPTEQLIVYTNQLGWGAGSSGIIDGTAGSALGFSPVPEPTSLALLGGSLLGFGLFARRRFAK